MDAQRLKDIDTEIAKLTGKKESRFLRVQRLYDLSLKLDDPRNLKDFYPLFGNLDTTVNEFHEIMDRLNELNLQKNAKYEVDYNALDAIEDLGCHIRFVASSLPPCKGQPVTPSSGDSVPLAQLPKIELLEFSGDPLKWSVFYDSFKSLIHENPKLDPITKAYYLMGSLKGRALEVCSEIPPTAANYPILWDTLVNKFQNIRLLADSYLNRLWDFRPISTESSEALNLLVDRFSSAYRALQRLQIPDLADFLVVSILLSKLDPATRKAFELSSHSKIPKFDEVLQFVSDQAGALGQAKKAVGPKSSTAVSVKQPQVLMAGPSESPPAEPLKTNRPCPLCRGDHLIYVCNQFVKAPVDHRWKIVQKHNWCTNCLSDVHDIASCQSKSRCRLCLKKHHSMLHSRQRSQWSKERQVEGDKGEPEVKSTPIHNLCTVQPPSKSLQTFVVLPTAVINIVTKFGVVPARFLVDSASQAHLITLKCCRRSQISVEKGAGSLGGIGGVSQTVRGRVHFNASSRLDPNFMFEVKALVLSRITNPMPVAQICQTQRDACGQFPLADDRFDVPGEIDGVLGAAIFAQILEGSPLAHSPSSPSIVPTKLGHIIMGVAVSSSEAPKPLYDSPTSLCVFQEPSLDRLIRAFWELEEIPKPSELSEEDKLCEDLFLKSTKRINGTRYCVQLPFKEFPPTLGNSRSIAERRFLALERKFQKNPEYRDQYAAVIKDYIDQGHLSFVHAEAIDKENIYFMPHFAVFKESSSTPLRVVFDASAKTSNGLSLNDVLLTGPKLQTDIQEVLLRFRLHPVAVVADIRQMYRNISVDPAHRAYQRILWRSEPKAPFEVLELTCVPFGLSPAPFLALRTVKQLANDEQQAYPVAARIALQAMYVDDVVASVPLEEAPGLYDELSGLFRAGGFSLVKWATNSPLVVKQIPKSEQVVTVKALESLSHELPVVKVLGLNWDAASDVWFFVVNLRPSSGTKREIMSTLARIWDPLGFLSPVTLMCKVLIKRLWWSKCGWDEPPPEPILKQWTRVVQELKELTVLKIPRFPGPTQRDDTRLVGFADSSEAGYGAVIYSVVQNDLGELKSTLLISKSKVTPMKLVSIPRLELCAALLLSELFQRVLEVFSFVEKSRIFALSDSEDVLYWVSKEPIFWKTFVANRVSKIQGRIPPERWFHIPSKENAADCVSRGMTPLQLAQHPDWVSGPSWLLQPEKGWPCRRVQSSKQNHPEARVFSAVVITNQEWQPIAELIQRTSSFHKLCSVVVMLLRFGKKLPKRPLILREDREVAERLLVRFVQQEYFADAFALIAQKKEPPSNLRALHPFIEGGCIRVGGRLAYAPISYNQKFPYLLPKKCHFVELIIDYYHTLYLHAGPNLLLSLIRQKFWILSARRIIRQRIQRCLKCFRFNPVNSVPPMAALPAARVSEAKPFSVCGVDYAGPFRVTLTRRRGVKAQKAYVCLFICFATKAVHLELATDLSTAAFLNCFSRFFARRGPINTIYSDCGTNFVGAKSALDDIRRLMESGEFRVAVSNVFTPHRVDWRFNPPAAPHFGGIWEANIKAMKTHLFRVIGAQVLSVDEFGTLLTQIEALLNSRPLTALSSDPAEPEALTPAHFLNLAPLSSLPTLSPQGSGRSLGARKAMVDTMVRHYWDRWHREYLTSLQPRRSRSLVQNSLAVGVVVLVREENTPPLHWPLGVIEKVYPGADGVVRVAEVRVKGKQLKRPAVKLYSLPNQ